MASGPGRQTGSRTCRGLLAAHDRANRPAPGRAPLAAHTVDTEDTSLYARAMTPATSLPRRPVETDDVIVLVLGAPGGPYKRGYMEGITRLEKLVFLLERETPVSRWLTESADFRSHKFGPFSSKIYKAADLLAAYGLLEDSARPADTTEDQWEALNVVGVNDVDSYTTRTFTLTERGRQYYAALVSELPPEAESVVSKFKERFGGLPLRQLVRYVYERYPEFTDKSEIRDEILG